MVYCKKFIVLNLLFLLLLFNLNYCFASEVENVSIDKVYDIVAPGDRNYFINYTGGCIGYFDIDKEFIYDITNITNNSIRVLLADEFPANNVTYTTLINLPGGETYSYLSNTNTKLYVCFNSMDSNIDFSRYITVTKRPSDNYVNVVDNLTSAVGPNALWDILGNTTSYILIVVSVALGLFLLVCAIRGISKTKTKF